MSQRDRMRNLFINHPNEWIPLPVILDLHPRISQYGRCIHELRGEGMVIENRVEIAGSDRHSWFRYVPAPVLKETKSGQYELAGV